MPGLHGGHTSVRSSPGDAHPSDSDVTPAEMLKKAGYDAGAHGSGASISQTARGIRCGRASMTSWVFAPSRCALLYPFCPTRSHDRVLLLLNKDGGRGQH